MDKLPFDPYDFFGYLSSGFIVLIGLHILFGFPAVVGVDLKPVDYAFLILATYVAGQIVATPAKWLLEDVVVGKMLYAPNVNLMRNRAPRPGRWVFPNFYKPLPKGRLEAIWAKAGSTLEGEALFLAIRFCPAILSNERLLTRIDGFRDRYGFNRNLSFTCLSFGTGVLVKTHFVFDPTLRQYGWTALIVGILLFYRYLKFYRQYSYELFNTYGDSA